MADEIAQVCQVEINGVTMVVKGGVEVAAFLLKVFKALYNLNKEHKQKIEREEEKNRLNILRKPGEKESFKEIMELASEQNGTPQCISVPEKKLEELKRMLEKNGVRYFQTVDFNPNDGKKPILIPPGDMVMAGPIIKSILEDYVQESEQRRGEYEDKIKDAEEKYKNASEEEKKVLEKDIENLTQAHDEVQKEIDGTVEILEKEEYCMSFQEYLAQSKGTDFEKDPDKAVTEYENGVEIGQKFPAKECMQPVRDKGLMPESKLMFYLPDTGITITREFSLDDKDVVYCHYSLKNDVGEIYEFTDKDITRKDWNEKVLPELLDKAEILETTPCRVFGKEESLIAYQQYHNQTKPKSEENIEKKKKADEESFSNADVKEKMEEAVLQSGKALASAPEKDNQISFEVETKRVTLQKGKLQVELDNGDAILFPDVPDVRGGKHENDRMTISIGRDDMLSLEGTEKNGSLKKEKISPEEVIKMIQTKQGQAGAQKSKADTR